MKYLLADIPSTKSGTICVQPEHYWHCSEGNLGETAERWGRACMDLSECYDAILSSNSNSNWTCKWCTIQFTKLTTICNSMNINE